ncbi:MAG TPA: glycoside hydrolase family 3 N-terminal domain-containing protein, partial [Candidatus Limnocylindrales bacterium]
MRIRAASPTPGPRISRRDLLRGTVLGATAIALAGCGSSVPASTGTPSGEPSGSASTSPPPSPRGTASPPATPASTPGPTASATTAAPTLRQKIASLIVVGFRGSTLSAAPWLRTALRDGLGGVVLFDRDQLTGARRNVVSRTQLSGLVRDLRAAAGGREIIVSIDEEGGIVTRLSPTWGFPAVASEAQIGRGTVAGARTWATGIASTLSSVGVNLNFAPVVDLDVNPNSPAIGGLDRSFGANADVVVAMATAEIDAHRRAGIRTTLKHFPGIGSSTTNTDFGVADVTKTWSR